mmetsp:Transcript_8783/g.28972  ORF Transcript_8783/g.28972 Transcript_8783/m.28972 type:complete len:243 (+) Transcript_8783:513-1241(+)
MAYGGRLGRMCRTAPQCLSTCAHIAHHAWHATMRHAYFKISIQHMREHQNVVQTCMHALVRRSQHLLIALIQGLARPRSVWRRSGAAMHGRGPPVPVAQQRHDGRHQHDADYKGVGEHGKHNDEADLVDDEGGRGEQAGEGKRHDGPGGGDDGAVGPQARHDGVVVAQARDAQLSHSRHQEDVVVGVEAGEDCECHDGHDPRHAGRRPRGGEAQVQQVVRDAALHNLQDGVDKRERAGGGED